MLEGKRIDEILMGIKSKKVKNKEQELREAIKNSLDPAKVLIIKNCLELMEEIQKKIKLLDIEIMSRVGRMKEDLEIAMSIPGIAFTSASAILAEIGDYRDFENGEKLAAWCGLTPKVSQSANMLVTGKERNKEGICGTCKKTSLHIASFVDKQRNVSGKWKYEIKTYQVWSDLLSDSNDCEGYD